MNEVPKGIPGEEIEKPKEPAPITGEELVAIMRSHRFMDMMDWAVSYADEYPDAESGFTVLRDAYDPSIVECSRVSEGETYAIRSGQMNDFPTAQEMTKRGLRPIFILDFHFHPSEGPIAPSLYIDDEDLPYGDIVNFEGMREGGKFGLSKNIDDVVMAPVIAMIGQRRKGSGIDVLMLQRPIQEEDFERLAEEELVALGKDLDMLDEIGNEDQAEVLRILRKHGFKAEMIRFDENLGLLKGDEKKVKKFAYQPEISRY